MKVVDEKGKLFGRLNIIDLLVIILVVAVAIVVGVKVLANRSAGSAGETGDATDLRFTVVASAQNSMVTDRLDQYVDKSAGKRDQLLANREPVENGYIVDYWVEPARYVEGANGMTVVNDPGESGDSGLVDIYFVIEARASDPINNTVVSQEVRIGKKFTVKTTHFEFLDAVIVDCVWGPLEPEA